MNILRYANYENVNILPKKYDKLCVKKYKNLYTTFTLCRNFRLFAGNHVFYYDRSYM